MKKLHFARARLMRFGAILLLVLLLMTGFASAATVRGQLNRRAGTSAAPAAGICITVYKPAGGRSPRACSDSQGMYYLPNIAPGDYQLEVWTSQDPRVQPIRYPVKVAEPYTDIQPVIVP
ncbi:MAG: carboxypeptidase-like regulatory domain-containing protein [Acidobacteriia bacterium]|nr:carboxypeptidase-like regulatory domain-containing protein [Terriglobia bacterium]